MVISFRIINMKLFKKFCVVSLVFAVGVAAEAQDMRYEINPSTGAISVLAVENDTTAMNWVVATDGSQYEFIGEKYGWGLGYFTGSDGKMREWHKPACEKPGRLVYDCGNIRVNVERGLEDGNIHEKYTFTNIGDVAETLHDIGIFTPFNDNYPNALECVNRRCNAHIWGGGENAYVCALRMGGYGPNVGLVVAQGSIDDYEIWERAIDKQYSQIRGVIALSPRDMTLPPGKSATIRWTIFPFADKDDFIAKASEMGCIIPSASSYVLGVGETATIEYGKESKVVKAEKPGHLRVELRSGKGKTAFADLLVFENIDSLIQRRADFIVNHQRMEDKADARYGAFMVYDNESDSIYLNDTPNCSPVDRDEGAERVGMGVFLAKHYIAKGKDDEKLKQALVDYADFLRNGLQTADFKTFSSVDKTHRNRAYNYVWIAEYYFLMYEITGDWKYAEYGYKTLRSMCDQFGHSFYAIGFPVVRGIRALETAGMDAERDALMRDFELIAESYAKNGVNYPPFEVNFEQSIVAPAVQLLCQMHILTGDDKYLKEAERHMPVMDAFNGFQPSYHLNDIAIRHWDGYWFGKKEMFGDTMPHYWSTITASSYHLYAQCTGDEAYQKRAENIVRNNLCLFSEEGKASCAYLYPKRVNGEPAKFYDPLANDQDWALAYWYEVMKGI